MNDVLTVMPSNNTGAVVRDLAERFPGRLAHLISPAGWRKPFLPYALDNGAFAFVVQDGMIRQDVPADADVVFVGGTLEWKWAWTPSFCAWFRRVHVGRVNRPAALEYLDHLGAESCDGTGWMRGDPVQLNGLIDFLAGRGTLRLFDSLDLPAPPLAALDEGGKP